MRKIILCLLLAGCATSPPPVAGVGPQTLNVADAALRSGNPDLALKISRAILTEHPGDRDAKLHEAAALYAMGRQSAAQSIYEELYAVQPNATIAAGLAKCLIQSDPVRAANLFRVALAQMPHNANLITDLGVADDLSGQHDAAQTTYHKALDIDPSQISAQTDLALSLALSGKSDEALVMLEPLARAQDATPRVRQDYGAVLAIAGNTEQAAQVLSVDLPLAEAQQAASGYRILAKNAEIRPKVSDALP